MVLHVKAHCLGMIAAVLVCCGSIISRLILLLACGAWKSCLLFLRLGVIGLAHNYLLRRGWVY
jgi:hypothetical protein